MENVHTREAQTASTSKTFGTPLSIADQRRLAVQEVFDELSRKDKIVLPFEEKVSPSKRRKSPGHDAMKQITFLKYQEDDLGLEHAIQQFRIRSPTLYGNDAKLNYLLEVLNNAVTSSKRHGTPRSKARWAPPPRLPQNGGEEEALAAPASPTLSIKHAPKDVTWPPLPPTLNIPDPTSGDTSANTSVHTSFNTSFCSEPVASQEPESPATSADSFYDANDGDYTQKSEFPMSSMGESTFDGEVDKARRQLQFTKAPVRLPTASIDFEMSLAKLQQVEPRPDSPVTAMFIGPKNHYQIPQGKYTKEEPSSGAQNNRPIDVSTEAVARLQAPREPADPVKSPELTSTRSATETPIEGKDSSVKVDKTLSKAKESPRKAHGSPGKAEESPRKASVEHVRVKRIPADGLTGSKFLEDFLDVPFYLRFEASRIMQDCSLSYDNLNTRWQHPRTFETLHVIAKEVAPAYNAKSEPDYKESSLSARMRWTDSKDGPLFNFQLLPPKHEQLNSFQRKLGAHRFLSLDIDPFSKSPASLGLGGQAYNIRERVLEMLGELQKFLDRNWLQFLTQQKSRRKGADTESAKTGITQYTLVALSGDNMQELSACTVVGWALPFSQNSDMAACKSYARLDLRASRTVEVLRLRPDEIRFVDDTYATDEPPDNEFNDPDHTFQELFTKNVVMNDGCSEAPEWVFRRIAQKYRLDYIPSAAQFRCAGAKGIIFKSRPDDDVEDPDIQPPGPLLSLTESQVKVKASEENLDPVRYDPNWSALNIIKFSHALAPSCLYLDLLPILIDRGVPQNAIKKIVLRQTKLEVDELKQALREPRKLREWIHQQNTAMEERRRDFEISTLAGFPRARTERVTEMLDSEFDPTKSKQLADLVYDVAEAATEYKKKNLRLTLPRSTMAIGIADPYGVLKRGEIHVNFSTPFRDTALNRNWSALNQNVLVARNPSARPSDIQKVKAVYKHELSHLHDVVVFSARGPHPLADKLSGGDYDGDMFWVCWEPSLVKPFKNAPAPQGLPEPESFGIEVDKRKLGEIVKDPNSEEQVRAFIRFGTANRLRPNLLGVVTKTHSRLAHQQNSLRSERAELLANLKDTLMDSDKNGRFFSEPAWEEVKKNNNLFGLPTPAYFQYVGGNEDSSNDLHYKQPDRNNIVDHIYFWILTPVYKDALESLKRDYFANAETYDEDLAALYDQMLRDATGSAAIKAELLHLEENLKQLNKVWRRGMDRHANAKQHEKQSVWDTAVIDTRNFFLDIRPLSETNPIVIEWLRQSRCELTLWDRIKASALAKLYHGRKIWIHIAGHEVCLLKSEASLQTRSLTMSAYLGLGVRKRKTKRIDVSEVDDEEFAMDEDDHLFEEQERAVAGAHLGS